MRAAAYLTLALGGGLLASSVALAAGDRSEKRLAGDHALTRAADNEAAHLEDYFEHARVINLITAQNPAFRALYGLPGDRPREVRTHGPVIRQAEDALAYLEHLYPTSVGEVCFIDRGGSENARFVRGVRAPYARLSHYESLNLFFAPTFALRPGQVYQSQPYISPDTHSWVISNATPVPGTGYPAAAIVHFEITVESFAREAAANAGGSDITIVDASSGRVVIDSRHPQPTGASLGLPQYHRFAGIVSGSARSGIMTIHGHRSAFVRLRPSPHNE